jgi:hypothetical protein
VNVETKEQSAVKAVDAHTFTRQAEKKFKQMLSACQKADGNCFLGQEKKVLTVEFMQQGTTIMSKVYYETQKKKKKMHRAT